MGDEPDQVCGCGHPFRPHILVCYDNEDPLAGGLMFCHELDECDCVRTWDVPQSGRPRRNVMPPPLTVEIWRQALRDQLRKDQGYDHDLRDGRGGSVVRREPLGCQ